MIVEPMDAPRKPVFKEVAAALGVTPGEPFLIQTVYGISGFQQLVGLFTTDLEAFVCWSDTETEYNPRDVLYNLISGRYIITGRSMQI